MAEEIIRVSCSGFGIIKIGSRYLVCHNSEKDRVNFFGGAYRFFDSQRSVLDELDVLYYHEWETSKKVEEGDKRDLRLLLPKGYLEKFFSWYSAGRGREVTPHRELIEELVHEEKLLTPEEARFELHFLEKIIFEDTSQQPICHYSWDYYLVHLLHPTAKRSILEKLEGHPHSQLLTLNEIYCGKSDNGKIIADSVRHIVKFPNLFKQS